MGIIAGVFTIGIVLGLVLARAWEHALVVGAALIAARVVLHMMGRLGRATAGDDGRAS